MNTPDTSVEQVALSTGNEIAAYYDRKRDRAAVFAFLPEADNTVSAAIALARTNVATAQALVQALRTLEVTQ